jgi:hypothetical protein
MMKKDALLAQGFTQYQISQYFNYDTNNGVCSLKFDIVDFNGKKITTIEDLRKYLAINEKQDLKNAGFSDDVIDEYFTLLPDSELGTYRYVPDDGDSYILEQGDPSKLYILDEDGNITKCLISKKGKVSEENMPTAGADGTYYRYDDLKENYDLTDKQIKEYFNISKNSAVATLKSGVKVDGVTIYNADELQSMLKNGYITTEDGKGIYSKKYLQQKGLSDAEIKQYFNETDGRYTVKDGKDFGTPMTFDTVDELMEFFAFDQREEFKNKYGLTDDIINKYFHLETDTTDKNLKYCYTPNKYADYNIRISNGITIITFKDKDGNIARTVRVKDGRVLSDE